MYLLVLFLCPPLRMSTSSVTRLLWSTWVASITMQHKRRRNHATIFLLRGPNQQAPREKGGVNATTRAFHGSRISRATRRQLATKKKHSNKTNLPTALPTLLVSFPDARGDGPCVIHILTSVFQCEGRIIHVCCGQLSPVWTSEIQTTSEQEFRYSMCVKYRKRFKKKNTKSLDICCTLNGLFILNFISISLMF